MAGIHLPDIGKLGIHVATGVKDKKKVSSMNNAEEARLKAFFKRVDTEEQERTAVIKKELRRMKRRKKRIDKRLEDIASKSGVTNKEKYLKNKTGCHLPSIFTKQPGGRQSKVKVWQNNVDNPVPNAGLVSKTTVFPIQDELDTHISIPSTSENTQKLPYLQCQTHPKPNEKQRNLINQKKMISVRKLSKESFSKKIKKISITTQASENSPSDPGCDGDQKATLDEKTPEFLGSEWDNIQSREPQLSLADAMLAIKTCRYLRTPSRQSYSEYGENFSPAL